MIKRISFRSPLFWILFSLAAATGTWFSIKYFNKSFPMVNLDISIDREDAIESAQKLNQKFAWHKNNMQQAANFNLDNMVQYYIELEAGGPEKFNELIKENIYAPYHWKVRLFKEHVIPETTILLKPDGTPYGFIHKIAETEPGASLSSEQAEKIAQTQVRNNWPFNLTLFKRVEKSSDTLPNGRIDHTFVYERTDKKIGEAPYRLTLIVRGDKLCHATMEIKVPESFKRTYEEMRSSNNTIARIASLFMYLLYFFGGVIGGLFFLMRRKKHLIWTFPLWWSVTISGLSFLAMLNKIPLYWMNYNTADSAQSFMFRIILASIQNLFMNLGITTLIILAAESLTRVAFGNQIRLWQTWSEKGRSSIQVIGKIITSYLLLGLKFAYVIGFYIIAHRYFGWWSPSEMLSDPNTLATFFPWIGPVSNSLYAGFIEECLFRAIPLSAAALIGRRLNKERLFIFLGFIVQAIIFSAAHANYAAQPAYARLVELLLPSFMYGGIYLALGLMPAIITHVVYDVILMALPIFISTADGGWMDKGIVLIFAAIPLLIMAWGLIKRKGWHELPKDLYYRYWQPPLQQEIALKPLPTIETKKSPFSLVLLTILSTVALISWIGITQFKADVEPLTINRQQAEKIALQHVPKEILNNTDWQISSRIISPKDEIHQSENVRQQNIFSWRMGGKELYHNLLGTYLNPLTWFVRFVKNNGTTAERAEEYHYLLSKNGSLIRSHHILPEDAHAPNINKEEARKKINQQIIKPLGEDFIEMSAIQTKHPNREDWLFTYSTITQDLGLGQKRLKVNLSGNEITDASQSIFVPQEWQRTYSQERTIKKLLNQGTMLVTFILLIMLSMNLLIRSKPSFYRPAAFYIGLFFIFKTIVLICNQLPLIISTFKTTEPFLHQLFGTIIAVLPKMIFKALLFGSLAGLLHTILFRSGQLYKTLSSRALIGITSGLIISAFTSCLYYFGPHLKPLWPSILQASSAYPALSIMVNNLSSFIEATVIILLIMAMIDYLTNGWHQRKLLGTFACILLGYASQNVTSVPYWLITGLISGMIILGLYVLAFRFSKASIPISMGVFIGLKTLHQGILQAFPGALLGSLISLCIILGIAFIWSNALEKKSA